MAVTRQENWLGNQRVDIPHLRSIESAVAGDIDLLAGTMLAGRTPQIISGFYIISTGVTTAVGLKLKVSGSSLIHFLASESGSIFDVPSDRAVETLNSTNPRIVGGFTPGQVNYVGLDFVRLADDSTVDVVEFIDSNSNEETPASVPLARIVDYRIVITTLDFDNNPGIAPVAKVVVGADGSITSLEDARNYFFRLGSGGTVPNTQNSFGWPAGRKENTSGDVFSGGDKAINSFKEWMNAMMSRIWEVGGGEYWYSPTDKQNDKLARSGTVFTSNGEYFEWDGTHLHWRGLTWIFANSTSVYNDIADQLTDVTGLTNLADGECIYVDVDRTQNLTGGGALVAVKGALTSLGSPETPGSRLVLAWRLGSNICTRDQSYVVGSSFKVATKTSSGTSKLSASYTGSSDPRTAAVNEGTGVVYGAGLTRGGYPDNGSFFLTFGDLTIGGRANDRNVIIQGVSDVQISGIVKLTGTVKESTLAGSPIAEASTLTLDSNLTFITATGAGIDYITTTGWTAGSRIYLRLANTVSVNHNSGSVPGGTANIYLKGGADATSNGFRLLELIYDGAHWVEPGMS